MAWGGLCGARCGPGQGPSPPQTTASSALLTAHRRPQSGSSESRSRPSPLPANLLDTEWVGFRPVPRWAVWLAFYHVMFLSDIFIS